MASVGFEELAVYQRAAELADEVRATVRTWNSLDLWSSGVQGIRAADSIGANIAEGMGRGTRPDQLRFLFIARGSAHELQHWLGRAEARQLPLPCRARERATDIGRMLNGLIRSMSRRRHISHHWSLVTNHLHRHDSMPLPRSLN